jgi:hypothetical protein
MKTVACITFTPGGLAEGLYTEVIDLASIGKLRVRRATWITFDHELQAWRVRDRTGSALFTAPTRRACLEWEQRYFMEYGLSRESELRNTRNTRKQIRGGTTNFANIANNQRV